MRFSITGYHRGRLARGAAVAVVGGIAAGCSSGAASLNDGLVTNSTNSSAPVMVAQADQPYPGGAGLARRSSPRYGKVVRPQAPVGGAVQTSAPAALPAPSSPGTPAPSAGKSAVSSTPLPPPTNAAGGRSAPSPQQARRAPAPASNPPQPAEQPGNQVAVLPQAPKPQERSKGQTGNTSSASGSYTVVSGDTLYAISRKTGASVERIKEANGLSSGLIRVGQTLVIPSGGAAVKSAAPTRKEEPKTADTVTTASSATPSAKEPEAPKVSAYTPPSGEADEAGKEVEASTDVAALTPGSTGVGHLRWPVRGRVVSNFSAGSSDGVDIAVPEGTAVRAAENGVVIYSGDGLKGFGNTVLVRHEDGLVTVYGHASQLKVKRGDSVKRGQEIALSGMSGEADRPKLHFEVRKGTNPVDPMTYLE